MIVFCGRYGNQPWRDLEAMPVRRLRELHAQLVDILDRESAVSTPTGKPL